MILWHTKVFISEPSYESGPLYLSPLFKRHFHSPSSLSHHPLTPHHCTDITLLKHHCLTPIANIQDFPGPARHALFLNLSSFLPCGHCLLSYSRTPSAFYLSHSTLSLRVLYQPSLTTANYLQTHIPVHWHLYCMSKYLLSINSPAQHQQLLLCSSSQEMVAPFT